MRNAYSFRCVHTLIEQIDNLKLRSCSSRNDKIVAMLEFCLKKLELERKEREYREREKMNTGEKMNTSVVAPIVDK